MLHKYLAYFTLPDAAELFVFRCFTAAGATRRHFISLPYAVFTMLAVFIVSAADEFAEDATMTMLAAIVTIDIVAYACHFDITPRYILIDAFAIMMPSGAFFLIIFRRPLLTLSILFRHCHAIIVDVLILFADTPLAYYYFAGDIIRRRFFTISYAAVFADAAIDISPLLLPIRHFADADALFR